MSICPDCGGEFQVLAGHWSHNNSHRPELTTEQKEITTGLLMGDGYINNAGKNYRLEIKTISENYLKYLDNIFGCLGSGVKLKQKAVEKAKKNRESGFDSNAKEENYSDIYIFSTRCHPKFN
jgi:hypothetical protein